MDLMTTEEAAEFLKLAPITLAKMRSEGRGPAYHKLGRAVRYKRADLIEYFEAGRRTSTSSGPVEATA